MRAACTAMASWSWVVLAPINLLPRKRPEDIGLLPERRRTFATSAKRFRTSSIRFGPASTDAAARAAHPRGSVDRAGISAACTSGTRCRCTRPTLLDVASARMSGVWALGVVSLLNSRPDLARPSPTGSGGNGSGRSAALALRSVCGADALKFAEPGYLMVFTQGALGYGLTSVIGAVVLEIFQGKHCGGIFGNHHAGVTAWRRRALRPDFCTTSMAATRSSIGIAVSLLSAIAIWRASPRKVRAVAGQLHKVHAGA